MEHLKIQFQSHLLFQQVNFLHLPQLHHLQHITIYCNKNFKITPEVQSLLQHLYNTLQLAQNK
jgi:hypothetical protein